MKTSLEVLMTLLLLMFSKPIFSQELWTLDDCVSYALENNLWLNDLEYTTAANRETNRQSFRDVLPLIRGKSDYSIFFGRSVDPNDNSFINSNFFSNEYSLEASLDLFQGFQKINTIKASKFIYKAAQEESLQQKYLLAFRVMRAFYDIQFTYGLIDIAKEQVEVSQANYDLVKRQIDLGLKAETDLYEAESLLLADKLNVTQSENEWASAKLMLMQEMNLEDTSDILIQEEINELQDISENKQLQSDSIYAAAKNFIPIIKAQEFRVKAAKKQVAIARGALYPTLKLQGAYGTGFFETIQDESGATISFKDQIRDNAFKFLGFSLVIPISGAWSGRSKIKQQKIEYLRAQNNLKSQEQELHQTIQTLVQEYKALRIEYEQSTKKMEAQRLTFTIAQKKYEKGLISVLELFTAKNLFANAQNENLQVRLRSEVNSSTLDFYKGLPVFNIK